MLSRAAILIVMFLAVRAQAGWEPSVEAAARSYPLSGAMTFELGYSAVLWGSPGGASNPWFGYIRPAVKGATAGSYNSGGASIALFPVSFLGVEAGAEAINNTNEYQAYDCDTYGCTGKYWRGYLAGTVGLGAGPVFLVGRGKIENLRQHPDQMVDFIEPTSGLPARANGDRLKTVSGAAGVKLGAEWKLIYAYSWSRMQELNGQSQTHLGIISWNNESWAISAGAGTFKSEIKDRELTGVLRLEWRALPHVGLL